MFPQAPLRLSNPTAPRFPLRRPSSLEAFPQTLLILSSLPALGFLLRHLLSLERFHQALPLFSSSPALLGRLMSLSLLCLAFLRLSPSCRTLLRSPWSEPSRSIPRPSPSRLPVPVRFLRALLSPSKLLTLSTRRSPRAQVRLSSHLPLSTLPRTPSNPRVPSRLGSLLLLSTLPRTPSSHRAPSRLGSLLLPSTLPSSRSSHRAPPLLSSHLLLSTLP
jgi:hypothetical protein